MKKTILTLTFTLLTGVLLAQPNAPFDLPTQAPMPIKKQPAVATQASKPLPTLPPMPELSQNKQMPKTANKKDEDKKDLSEEVLAVPNTTDPIKGALIQKDNAPVKLRVPMYDGTTMDLMVDREYLVSQLGNFTLAKNSYQFNRTPIVDALSSLAILMNKSFEPPAGLAGDGVTAMASNMLVTGVYKNMSPMEVFYRIARTHGLRVRQEDSVLRVFKEDEINVSELEAVVYRTKYVNLYNFIDSIKAFLSPKGRFAINAFVHQGNLEIDDDGTAKTEIDVDSLFGPINSGDPNITALGEGSSSSTGSGGGSFSSAVTESDKDTTDSVMPNNDFSITVFDLPEVHKAISTFLTSIDKPKRQIAIQLRLYSFNDRPESNVGVNWSSVLENYAVNLNLDEKVGGGNIEFGSIDNFSFLFPGSLLIQPSDLSIFLNFIKTQTTGFQIASPNAIAQHGQTSFLRSVTRRPIIAGFEQTGTGTDATRSNQVEFLDIGTTLNVTPYVLNDEPQDPRDWELYLDLRPEITRAGDDIDLGGDIGVIPEVIAVAPTTSVRMKNGDTVMIGGLTDKQFTKTYTGLPFIEDVPLLNWIFGNKTRNNSETELVILVTGTILDTDEKLEPESNNYEMAEMVRSSTQSTAYRTTPAHTPYSHNLLSPEEMKTLSKNRSYTTQTVIPVTTTQTQTMVAPAPTSTYQGTYMRSPYAPYAGLIDVSGFHSGDQARCPFTGKIFIIP